jgi:dihydroorotate dehydrogenase electron transfer subunit
MAKILSNIHLAGDFFLMRAEQKNGAGAGQFYMLRGWGEYPVLSRPISVFDSDGSVVSFLYKVVGKGTELLSRLTAGDEISLLGPLGNILPAISGKIALVGGGAGIAPVYFAAKSFKENPINEVGVFLGFSGDVFLEDEYREASHHLLVKRGGFITDDIRPEGYDFIFTCGPLPMMEALYLKCKNSGVGDKLYVSLESRMACGIGSCLVCSCKTAFGRKKICADGPVFLGKDVFEI